MPLSNLQGLAASRTIVLRGLQNSGLLKDTSSMGCNSPRHNSETRAELTDIQKERKMSSSMSDEPPQAESSTSSSTNPTLPRYLSSCFFFVMPED